MWDLPGDEGVAAVVHETWSRGGIIAAICHGPAAFAELRGIEGVWFVDGVNVTCYSDAEERAAGLDEVVPFLLESALAERGARIRVAEPGKGCVTVDRRIITGQNPASTRRLAEALRDAVLGLASSARASA